MSKLLGNLKKGLLFVISAPSGVGKTTISKMLQEEFSCVAESVSCTTRKPREGEVDGKDYHFITQKQFEEKLKNNEFLEHVEFLQNSYGTLKSEIEANQSNGKHVLLVIDTEGAKQIKKQIKACFIFLLPPTLEELENRLQKRKSESIESLKNKIALAQKEIKEIKNYDYCVVNDDLNIAYQVVRAILIAEEHKTIYRE